MKKILMWIAVALIMQSCGPAKQKDYVPDWDPPVTTHSLVFPESMQLLWTQQAYILSSAHKNIQCLSTNDVLLLVGSQNSNDTPKIFALDGKDGVLLWKFDDVGVLADSADGVFIGSQTTVYLVDAKTGAIKWQKQLPGIRHITSMMYYENLLFVNGSAYPFYVLDTDGTIISRYSQVEAFRSAYSAVPFYPTLPFGVVIDDDIQIVQTGDGLYSADIYDRNSGAELWQIDRDSISNFVVLGSYMVWIASDGTIKFVDKYSGKIEQRLNVDPKIDFFNTSINIQHSGYYLCGDNESNNLYAILGDSRQIFAINFKK